MKKTDIKNLARVVVKKYGIMIIFLIFSSILSIITPNFLTFGNIFNILRQASIIGVIAIGTTFVIIGGGFDISVGSLLALTGAMVYGFQNYMHWGFAVILILLLGAFIGMVNGLLAVKIHIASIIATLAMMTILRGLVYLYTGGYPFTLMQGASEGFLFIGQGYLGPFPFPVVILIVMVAFGQFILIKTKFGRYTSAIGGNKEASRLSGVKVDFYHIMTFTVGGLMAAIAGVIYASRLMSVTPLAGQGYELDAIAATVIGGTSVSGGEGSVVKTLIGVLLLSIISNIFNLMGINVYVQYIIKGLIILFAVGFDSYTKK
ncbi:MAG: ABC transporter permease [Spirochaetota bacterium]